MYAVERREGTQKRKRNVFYAHFSHVLSYRKRREKSSSRVDEEVQTTTTTRRTTTTRNIMKQASEVNEKGISGVQSAVGVSTQESKIFGP